MTNKDLADKVVEVMGDIDMLKDHIELLHERIKLLEARILGL